MGKFNVLDWIAFIVMVIGGLVWGLIGFFDFNLVTTIFGDETDISRIIYAIIGIAALYLLIAAITKQPKK